MTEKLPVFILSSIVLLAIPGPDMLAIVSRGIHMGKRIAMVTTLGYLIGDVIQTAFVALGLAALINSNPVLLEILRIAGAGYLIYLGTSTLLNRHRLATPADEHPGQLQSHVLRQSIVASIINPKTALFFIAFLPQFVSPGQGNEVFQILFLGAVFAALGFIAYMPVALCAGAIGQWLGRSPSIRSKLPVISGSIFIGLGIFLGFYQGQQAPAN
ncbi:MAG: LysE family translocator [Candidatus Dactylopiibacterium sp.]|nr:LysE family translocator [Candidatus Dactylopiibacterium sp.]